MGVIEEESTLVESNEVVSCKVLLETITMKRWNWRNMILIVRFWQILIFLRWSYKKMSDEWDDNDNMLIG